MSSSGVIAVSPTGSYNVVVDISDAFGSRATVYSDATRTASVTLPATVTATTEFFVEPGYYTTSGKVGGTETLGHRDYVGEGCRNAYNAGVAGSVAAASSGGSTPLYYFDLNHNSSAANYFAWESIPLKSNGVQIVTVATPLLTIAPGGGIAEPELIMPAFLSGSVEALRFELDVSNAGGTQKTTWETTALGTLAASSDTFVDLSTATTFDVIGSDITWDATFGGPISAAGGQFMVKALILLSITNLA